MGWMAGYMAGLNPAIQPGHDEVGSELADLFALDFSNSQLLIGAWRV
jgi:hypothetical protein